MLAVILLNYKMFKFYRKQLVQFQAQNIAQNIAQAHVLDTQVVPLVLVLIVAALTYATPLKILFQINY